MRSYSADTHAGLVREHNEDCFLASEELGLWLVADGIGGHASGEVASSIVCQEVEAGIRDGMPLTEAITSAHRAVLEEIAARDNANNMGSTVVALRVRDDDYEIAWVGDSRAYLWDGELRRLTTDHSYVEELVEHGVITPEEADSHPDRHIITRSLGVSEVLQGPVGHCTGRLQGGAQLLLCSDGLSDELSDAAIAVEMHRHRGPAAQVKALVGAALQSGGRDNVTVVVLGAKEGQRPRDMDTTQDFESNTGAHPIAGPRRYGWVLAVVALVLIAWTVLG